MDHTADFTATSTSFRSSSSGFGQELGLDPGRVASLTCRLPIHTHWYKATIGHNTVLVDGASQAAATGKLELFTATFTHVAVVAS